MSVRRICVAGALAFGWLACATPTPVARPIAADDPRPGALLARFAGEVRGRQGLRGIARLSVDAERPGEEPLRLRSKQRLVVARPARLRVEVQGLLGTTLAVLAVDAGRYAFFQVEDRRFESGAVHPALLRNLVGLDLAPPDAVDVLLGRPELDGALRILAAYDLGKGLVRVELASDAGQRRSLDLDPEARLRRWVRRAADGALLWDASFEDYAAVAGSPLAHRVSLTLPRASAVLALSGVELNPTLTPDMFRIDPVGVGTAEGG